MLDAIAQAVSIITILIPRLLLPVVAEPKPVIYSPPVAVVDQWDCAKWPPERVLITHNSGEWLVCVSVDQMEEYQWKK